MKQCLQGSVMGKVQGVYFRDSMRKKAHELNIQGWVKNCADGRVAWLIMGEPEALAAMQAWLQVGPARAKVEAVTCEAVECQKLTNFTIKHD